MRKLVMSFLLCGLLICTAYSSNAQCSICTKTTQQLGEKPAKGMNGGILYLAFTPLLIVGVIAYRWVKGNRVA